MQKDLLCDVFEATNPFSSCRFIVSMSVLGLFAGLIPTASAQKITAPGFKSELLFKVPEIEHPSSVVCDDDGNLFVGEDPMDMRGPATKEFDRIIYFRWVPGEEKPRRTVFAENLSAVFGLVWHEGWLYVLHAPHYSRFRDKDGDGVAEIREELADGFGPPAGIFGFNDHIVTGTRMGMDGYVYVSVGDKGIQKATGSDGRTLTLEGGGVIRMRPDGSKLEIFSSGTRNHLDVAMDSLDNIFTYDNTDDGLGWWTRLTHHVMTGYYGYPFDYHPHPERHLPRISEHGGGSPCGAVSYREALWPAKYHDAAFFCEWGKGKVQCFHFKKQGATFSAEIEDFMVNDGTGEFRPVDACVSPDGKYLYVADWQYGGWVRPDVVGRVYRVSYTGTDMEAEPPRAKNVDPIEAQIRSLGHPAFSERTRAQYRLAHLGKPAIEPLTRLIADKSAPKEAKIHAIWALEAMAQSIKGFDPTSAWLGCLADEDADVRGQLARALANIRRQRLLGRSLNCWGMPIPRCGCEPRSHSVGPATSMQLHFWPVRRVTPTPSLASARFRLSGNWDHGKMSSMLCNKSRVLRSETPSCFRQRVCTKRERSIFWLPGHQERRNPPSERRGSIYLPKWP